MVARPNTAARALRELIGKGLVTAPGCFDALSARLAERAGHRALYLSGFALSAAKLGQPDLGLLGPDDVVDAVRRITQVTDIPLIADIDTGYGGPLNIARTVQEVEAAGAAAVQIEDQVMPKRCGHFLGKDVVDEGEAARRVEVAAHARRDPATILIARTDVLAVGTVDDATGRARRFVDAGADVVFVEAVSSLDELRAVDDVLGGTAQLFNWVEGGRSPSFSREDLEQSGVRILIHPITAVVAAIEAQQAAYASLAKGEVPPVGGIAVARDAVGAAEATAFHDAWSSAMDAGRTGR